MENSKWWKQQTGIKNKHGVQESNNDPSFYHITNFCAMIKMSFHMGGQFRIVENPTQNN